jgi:hypothetical protein
MNRMDLSKHPYKIWRCSDCGVWGRLAHRYLAPKNAEEWEKMHSDPRYVGICNPDVMGRR